MCNRSLITVTARELFPRMTMEGHFGMLPACTRDFNSTAGFVSDGLDD